MAKDDRVKVARREVVGASMALATLGLVGGAPAKALQRSVSGGLAGGGVVQTGEGEAQFSLFASRLTLAGATEPTVFGKVRWVDPGWQGQGLMLESEAVTAYGPPNGDPTSNERMLQGTMRAIGAGAYPFALHVTVAGPDRFGGDTISLVVGPEAAGTPEAGTPAAATPTDGFAYAVRDVAVTAGDLELLSFDRPNQG